MIYRDMTPAEDILSCPLCGSGGLSLIDRDERRRRPFYLCPACALVSVPPQYHLSASDELARYALHDNAMSNQGYVGFLSETADAAVSVASEMRHSCPSGGGGTEQPIKLLDFGCGREAALCRLLAERGMDCRPYDPLYDGINKLPDAAGYDIIVANEVVEHLRDIAGELRLMNSLLRGGGALVIRTQLYDAPGSGVDLGVGKSEFRKWWYAQDPTHINFFGRKSLSTLAVAIGKRVEGTGRRDIFVIR